MTCVRSNNETVDVLGPGPCCPHLHCSNVVPLSINAITPHPILLLLLCDNSDITSHDHAPSINCRSSLTLGCGCCNLEYEARCHDQSVNITTGQQSTWTFVRDSVLIT